MSTRYTMKCHKLTQVMQCLKQFETHQAGQLESAQSKVNFRFKPILESMTADQLRVLLFMTALGNSEGYRQSREQRRNLLVGYDAKTRERRLELKVIDGGAA